MTVDDEQALAEVYRAHYGRLVSVLGAIAQDRQEAEEVVQDAFVRLFGQWSKAATSDDPEAWLRKVALGYLSNRRRSARRFARAVHRQRPVAHEPPVSADRVDLDWALAALPRRQRDVVVLRSLGLTTAEIAAQVVVPVGTVKSRLSRARDSLLPAWRGVGASSYSQHSVVSTASEVRECRSFL